MRENGNKTIVVNGVTSEINISDLLDLTDPKQVKMFNEERKKNFKKSFYFGFGIKNFGLGDIVDNITTYTGIKKIIKLIFKECGCEKRRQYLNKWNVYFPYIFIKFNLKSSIKDIQPIPRTEIKINPNPSEGSSVIPRSMVKKTNSGCGCNKKKMQ